MHVNLKWDALWASIPVFGTQPSSWGLMAFIGGAFIVGGIGGLIAMSVAGWRMQRLLEPFGDILTVALAHRHRESMTTQSME